MSPALRRVPVHCMHHMLTPTFTVAPARCDHTRRPSGSDRSPAAARAFAEADAQATHRSQAARSAVRWRAMGRGSRIGAAPSTVARPPAIRLVRASWLSAHPTVSGSPRPRAA